MALTNLMINYTERCNSRCRTCNIWAKKNPQVIPLHIFYQLFRSPILKDVVEIFFTGGETLMDDHIVDITKTIQLTHPKAKIMMATNCLEPQQYFDRLEQIRAMGFYTVVGLSLMGIGSVHDYYRGVEGNYEKVLEMIDLLKGKHFFYFSYTRMPMSQHQMVLDLVCQHNTYAAISNFRKDGRFGTKGTNINIPKFECLGLKSLIGIHPNGDVSACDHFYPELVVGNLHKIRIEDMDFSKVRKYVEEGKCQPCPIMCWKEFSKNNLG